MIQLTFNVVHPAGIEPTTFAVGGRHSIQLRYECIDDRVYLPEISFIIAYPAEKCFIF